MEPRIRGKLVEYLVRDQDPTHSIYLTYTLYIYDFRYAGLNRTKSVPTNRLYCSSPFLPFPLPSPSTPSSSKFFLENFFFPFYFPFLSFSFSSPKYTILIYYSYTLFLYTILIRLFVHLFLTSTSLLRSLGVLLRKPLFL